MRRSWQRPEDDPVGTSTTSGWTGAEPADAAGPADVIEGGAPSRRRPPRLRWRPRLRWVVGVATAVALAAGGTGVVWKTNSADDVPTLAALRAAPSASSGLLRWAPRGPLAGDEVFVREAVRTLRSSGPVGRPRTWLHLLYAGDRVVLLEGVDRNGGPALAQVADGHVLVNRLPAPAPVALTLPTGARLRFLVPPATSGAPGPAVVWVEDASLNPAGGFRSLPTGATGLTDEFQPAPGDARFAVLEPWVTDTGMISGDRLRGDGVLFLGSLTPRVPAIQLTRSPWPTQGDQPPSRQWLADAELLGAGLTARGPARVAALTGGGGFTPGPPRPDGKIYSGGLYAVTDAAGRDYVGYVLRFGGEPLCHRLTPVTGRFADLLVVGGRCELPGESVAAVVEVITRADVRRGVVELSGLPGQPQQQVALGGGASSGPVDFLAPPTRPSR